LSVAALLECARAYLAISDTAGARTALDEAQRISRRRPELGTLITELGELDRRTAHAAETLVGSSTLTPAELRLLPFLSTHLTFEEIGDRLSVSRHTIKTQAMSVYGKLQTSSRSQTVERAVALGLLEPFPGLPLRSVEDD
jgi:LuxR family maltose regulon positive regulatory protein